MTNQGEYKKELIKRMNEFLDQKKKKKEYYREHPEEVKQILDNGTKIAKEKAQETMKKVKTSMKINY